MLKRPMKLVDMTLCTAYNRHICIVYYSFTQGFVGMSLMGTDNTMERLQQRVLSAFSHIRHSSATSSEDDRVLVEFMVHPGYPCIQETEAGCGGGPDDFAQSTARQHEMDILNSNELKYFFRENKINSVSFSELLHHSIGSEKGKYLHNLL